ncbi:MAG: ABC transporter permease [SAR324 cluster bacterium]|nr:ABC transporter permease [SAR324 cluster bacterium]
MYLTLEKRLNFSTWTRIGISIAAVGIALIIGGIFLFAVGVNPLTAYGMVWNQVFMDYWGWQDLMVKMIPFLLTGIAVAVAAQMKIWNIGAEGQLYLGAVAATWTALQWGDALSGWVMIPVMILAAMFSGAMWAAVPGFLRAQFGVNEIITTLLLNYVAISWVDYLLYGPWRDPGSNNFPVTREFSESAQLPLFGDSSVHLGLILGLVAILIVYFILEKTKIGYQIRVAGDNLFAAQYSGFNIKWLTLAIVMVSGALAGIAGMGEVAGIHFRLKQNFSINYGYTGIIVAWLARNHPLAVIVTAFFMASVFVGGELMQLEFRLPIAMVYLFEGIILFSVLGSEIFAEYKLKFKKVGN